MWSLNPPRDQFFARALFVASACEAKRAEELELHGSNAVRQLLRAAEPILEALSIAEVISIPPTLLSLSPYTQSSKCRLQNISFLLS